jgi:dolichol-phosphate mannosyltransferase
MKVFLVLPAYNEAAGLREIIPAFDAVMRDAQIEHSIAVLDDGSTDDTYATVRGKAAYVRHETNLGLGQTIEDALRYAVAMAQSGDVVVTMDADNTHPVDLIPRMLAKVMDECDVVVASRYRKGSRVMGLPWFRQVLSYGARFLFQSLCPIPGVRDYTCGFRAYRAETLKFAFANGPVVTERGFAAMAEILLRLHRLGARAGEVPMTLRYDLKDGRSKNRIGATILTTLRVAWRNR